MKSIIRFILAFTLIIVVTPSAFATPEQERDWAPSDPCGSIDPDRACYMNTAPGACPENTSYSNCMARCDCEWEKNVERCDGGKACLDLAATEKRACYGNCVTDWS